MRTVIKTYKFKLYNSKKNKHLNDSIDIAADIWNFCIAMHRMYYLVYGKSLSANQLKKYVTKLKKRFVRTVNTLNHILDSLTAQLIPVSVFPAFFELCDILF